MTIGSLPLFHRISGTRVVVVGDGAMGEAKRRLVERAGGIACSEAESHHARLAFVALEDERAARAAAQKLKSLGLLVNVADRPELCDFTTPSILDRDPVLIAISTGGASAGLAKHIRLRLEQVLPATLGKLALALHAARAAIRRRFPDGDDRRRAIDEALSEGSLLDPFDGAASERVDAWLEADSVSRAGSVVALTICTNDPDDLTIRQARQLGMADVVLHDAEIPAAILDRSRADALRRALPQDPDEFEGLVIILRRG